MHARRNILVISKSKACQWIENNLQVFKGQSSISLNVWRFLLTISNEEITMFLERRQVNTQGSIVWSFHFSLSKIVLLLVLEGPDNTKFNLHCLLFYQPGGNPLHMQWLSDSYTNGQREIVRQCLTWKILIQELSLLIYKSFFIRSRRIVIELWTEVSDGPHQPSSQLNWRFLQRCRTASQECFCVFVSLFLCLWGRIQGQFWKTKATDILRFPTPLQIWYISYLIHQLPGLLFSLYYIKSVCPISENVALLIF